MPTQDPVADLLSACARGGRRAIERVFREASSRRHAICWTLLRSEPLAEDVLQDVFIKIWCPDGSFDSSRGYPKLIGGSFM
ncbi:MAG: hypothetical protein M3120_06745 [Pseudomonadota bacterium]|nr:hypothetical protein [Pseudomonadota bacterium]